MQPAGRADMALTDAQQELLHAFVDGETTHAETQIAQQLLAREAAARTYVEELQRLRQLLLTHGCVNAPAGLRRRVCAALEKDFNAPPLIALPRMAWRSALYAAAAAVVVSLALVVGPQLDQRPEQPEQGIAQAPVPGSAVPETPAEPEPAPPPRPALWTDANDLDDGINEAGKAAPVLRLDRGVDQPLELSLDLNRHREASALQVYNDILIVSSLYGDARLQDGAPELEEFAGRDFSAFDGVEVELESGQVPQLLAALDRMNADQAYGRIIVPADLRRSIKRTTLAVAEIQKLSRDAENADNGAQTRQPGPKVEDGARAYLPPEVQREMLRRDEESEPGERHLLGSTKRGPDTAGGGNEPEAGQGESRKIKLVIKLR